MDTVDDASGGDACDVPGAVGASGPEIDAGTPERIAWLMTSDLALVDEFVDTLAEAAAATRLAPRVGQ